MAYPTQKPRGRGKLITLGVGLIAVGAALLLINALRNSPDRPAPEPQPQPLPAGMAAPNPEAGSPPDLPDYPAAYDTDKLEVDPLRERYQSGELWLYIPRIDYAGPVLDGVDEETLEMGIGLYDYAKLPSWGNPNTAIAGHRDAGGFEFYYLDTVEEGDRVYLTWQNSLYTYRYVDTVVVDEDDWSVIYCTDLPIVTLTTCTPLGTSDYRMIVTAELVEIRPLEEGEDPARLIE